MDKFFEDIVPGMNHAQFRHWFHMNPSTFDTVVLVLENRDNRCGQMHSGCKSMPIDKCLGMMLSFVGCQIPLYHLSNMFDVSEDAFIRNTDCILWLLEELKEEVIAWPAKSDYDIMACAFDQIGMYFPNVLGAIDGCHLPIELHEEDAVNFYNFKQYHSINLMAVSLSDLRFSYIFAGWPRHSHDGHVFRNLDLADNSTKNEDPRKNIGEFIHNPGG